MELADAAPLADPGRLFELETSEVIACLPVYKEDERSLNRTLLSFKEMERPVRTQLVIIVDGCEKTRTTLHRLLGLGEQPRYVTSGRFSVVKGWIPYAASGDGWARIPDPIPFTLVHKHRQAGKRDTQLLFLEALKSEVAAHLARRGGRVADEAMIGRYLRGRRLSILMVDSDTGFERDAVQLLHATLWQPKNDRAFGAAGMTLPRWNFRRPLEAAQNFEYRTGQFCDKASQSTLGFVLCLQGAFCLYRASDLLQDDILSAYGRKPTTVLGINKMEMGEDRYLTILLLKRNLESLYVAEARSYTTPPATMASLLLQRRRWQNSVLGNLTEIVSGFSSTGSWRQKIAVTHVRLSNVVEMLGLFTLPVWIFLNCHRSIRDSLFLDADADLPAFLVFCALLLAVSAVALFRHPVAHPTLYRGLFLLLSGPMLLGLSLTAIQLVEAFSESNVHDLPWLQSVAALGVGIAWLPPALRARELNYKLIYCWLCYLLCLPCYLVTIPIYALVNFADVSWGTRDIGSGAGRPVTRRKVWCVKLGMVSFLSLVNAALAWVFMRHPAFAIWSFVVLVGCAQLPKVALSLSYRSPAPGPEEAPAAAESAAGPLRRRPHYWQFEPIGIALSVGLVLAIAGHQALTRVSRAPLVTRGEFVASVMAAGYPEPPEGAYDHVVRLAGPLGEIHDKRELAMFLANALHESAGLREVRERGCPGGDHCEAYQNEKAREDPRLRAKLWYGRGYLQLSWNDNYEAASRALYGDDRLLDDPDLVADDDEVAWSTAFWYWRRNIGRHPLVREGSFGTAVDLINGPHECRRNKGNLRTGAQVDPAPFDHRARVYASLLRSYGWREAPRLDGCN